MRPLPYVWPYALLFWAVFVWAYLPEFAICDGHGGLRLRAFKIPSGHSPRHQSSPVS